MVQYAKVAATPKHPAASIDLEGASMTRDGTGPRDCALGARAWAVGVLKTEDSEGCVHFSASRACANSRFVISALL